MSQAEEERTWSPLTPRQRRVLGVLVEKQKTTPESYPLSVSAIVTGCNQKSNRDPVTNYDMDDAEETLQQLRKLGAAVMVEGSGRVVKWKHTLYDWLGLRGRAAEMAVMAELMLRGPQTEGELRQRASRMDAIPDLPALQTILNTLNEMGLVIYLTPPGVRRGAVVAHNLYPPEELERIKQNQAQAVVHEREEPTRGSAAPGWTEEVSALRAEVQELRATVESLAAHLRELRESLGA